MSDLIKKIKIKKQDGAYTDYIPIGAEAKNVDCSDGESVEYKLNKKPYYYNNVADMKADTNLKVGDMAITLGYYEINDGGGAEYKIIKGTYIEDSGNYHKLENNLYAELIIKDIINIKQFGTYGDGIHDDTTKIKNFIKIKANKHIFNEGVYLINENIQLESNMHIVFAEGAIIKREKTSSDTYFILEIPNKENIILDNVHLIGEKDEHEGTTGEWGYGIYVWSSKNIVINNAIVEKTWGDGFYIGYRIGRIDKGEPKFITLNNCKALSCSRNGFAICGGETIYLNNCYAYGTKRTDPKAGLDIEPETATQGTIAILKNVIIDNFISENNTIGICYGSIYPSENITINNHKSIDENYGFVVFQTTGSGNLIYQNSSIIKPHRGGIQITKKKDTQLILKNIIIDSTTLNEFVHSYEGAITIITTSNNDGNLIIDNLEYIKSYSDLYTLEDIICERGTGVFSNLTIKNVNSNKYICLKNCDMSTTVLDNCNIYRQANSQSLTFTKQTYSNKIQILNPLQMNTVRNFDSSLPDGEYELIMTNNTSRYRLDVSFVDCNVINIITSGTYNNYKTFENNAYLKFQKKGNNIFIIDNTLIANE